MSLVHSKPNVKIWENCDENSTKGKINKNRKKQLNVLQYILFTNRLLWIFLITGHIEQFSQAEIGQNYSPTATVYLPLHMSSK